MNKLINYTLLILNIIVAYLHYEPLDLQYFFQLTNYVHYLIIIHFILAIKLHHQPQFSKYHSYFAILTFNLAVVVAVGYWSLRIFFEKGIINYKLERNLLVQILSVYTHGINTLGFLYILLSGKIQYQFSLIRKIFSNLGIIFIYALIQIICFYRTGEHVYGFLQHFSWKHIFAFESALTILSILSDYFLCFILEHRDNRIKFQKSNKLDKKIK